MLPKVDHNPKHLRVSSLSPDKFEDVSARPCIYLLALILQHLLLGTGISILIQHCKGKIQLMKT
jgi:hypothetical protein